MRGMSRLILVVLGLLLTIPGPAARAQAALNVPVFPSGKLSPEQLASVGAAIRRLEANPLASDGATARHNLLTWLEGSPDVTVNVCEHVAPMAGQRSEAAAFVFLQFVLSSAAFMIEHPDRASDQTAVDVGGVEGALHTYTLLKAHRGDEATNGNMEALLQAKEQGQLEANIRASRAKC